MQQKLVSEKELARLAKRFRKEEGVTRAQAGRELRVSQTSIFQAEQRPEMSLTKLRIRMIEWYSIYKVQGPAYALKAREPHFV